MVHDSEEIGARFDLVQRLKRYARGPDGVSEPSEMRWRRG